MFFLRVLCDFVAPELYKNLVLVALVLRIKL